MTKPYLEIENSIDNEYYRFLFICYYLKQYFYQIKGFKVLPYKKESSIYLPDIPILYDKDFWKYLNKNDINIFQNDNYKEEVLKQLKPYNENIKIKINKRILDELISDIQIIFPDSFKKIKKIKILITNFGSYCSNFTIESKSSYPIIFFRKDAPLSHLFEAILMIILGGENNSYSILNKNVSWEEKELLIDMLLGSSVLNKYVTKYFPTIQSLKHIDKKTERDSKKFLTKLGFLKFVTIKYISKGQYYINSNKIQLTFSEDLVFRTLLKNRNKLVTFEEIADNLWKYNSDKYSLQAITKIIQRIREKIRKSGISPFIINTVKGIGYEMQ